MNVAQLGMELTQPCPNVLQFSFSSVAPHLGRKVLDDEPAAGRASPAANGHGGVELSRHSRVIDVAQHVL